MPINDLVMERRSPKALPPRLNERERSVLKLMADGKRQAEIGDALGVTVRTFYDV